MEEIRYVDTEGREVYLFRSVQYLSEWTVQVDGENIGIVWSDKDGNWLCSSISIAWEDFDTFVWVIEQYECKQNALMGKIVFRAVYGDAQEQ